MLQIGMSKTKKSGLHYNKTTRHVFKFRKKFHEERDILMFIS